MFMYSVNIFAQNIEGTVSSDDGTPLPGATVLVVETSQGTSTDFDGNYSLNVELGQTLEFSFQGYESVRVEVSSSDSIDVALQIS